MFNRKTIILELLLRLRSTFHFARALTASMIYHYHSANSPALSSSRSFVTSADTRLSLWRTCLQLLRTSRLIAIRKNSINSTDALQRRYWTVIASCQRPRISSWSRPLLNTTEPPRIVPKHQPHRCNLAPDDSEQDITNGLRTGTLVTNHRVASPSAGDASLVRSMYLSARLAWTSNTSSSSQRS